MGTLADNGLINCLLIVGNLELLALRILNLKLKKIND